MFRSLLFSSARARPTALYSLSLHDALPISPRCRRRERARHHLRNASRIVDLGDPFGELAEHAAKVDFLERLALGHAARSEEHTSELQSRLHLVCRLLLEKKNTILR